MVESIRFSVHIPVYNVEKYLVDCVNSVLNQSYTNFEIILVDDGSPDKSPEICDSFTDSRIRVFHNENHGVLYSRYFAVMQARGEYSVFIDGDDFIDTDFLEKINGIIDEEKCDIVVFSYKRIFDNRIEMPDCMWKEKTVFEKDGLSEFEKKMLLNPHLNSLCLKTIKTSLMKADKTGFEKIKAKTGEDLLASLYPVFNADKIVYVPEHWYNYRQNDESVTHTIDPDRYKSMIAVRKQSYEYLKSSSFFSEEVCSEFASMLVKLMMDCVILMAGSDFEYERKLQTFNGIMSDEFYNTMLKFLNKSALPKKRRVIFELFRRKQYRTIILICRLIGK